MTTVNLIFAGYVYYLKIRIPFIHSWPNIYPEERFGRLYFNTLKITNIT